MPPKRARVYQRTFIGCWTCRRRKIKCDATKPGCNRCLKSKLKCEGYDIKLNWSAPLVIQDDEMTLLNDDADSIDNDTFQRSNIQPCIWNLYSHYEDIDDDLEQLSEFYTKRGPFSIFRFRNDDGISLQPNNEIISNQIHHSLHRFVQLSIQALELPIDTPFTFPLPTTNPQIHDTRPVPSDLNKYIQHDGSVSISQEFIRTINQFMEVIPMVFNDSGLLEFIGSTVKTSLGDYIINPNDMDLLLLINIILISQLFNNNINLQFYKFSKKLFNQIQGMDNDLWVLNLIFMIMINSSLGIYNPNLFQYEPIGITPLLESHYEFLKSMNSLLNHSQFKLDSKFSKLYQDLHKDYNLLKNFKNQNKVSSNNGYGIIQINTKDTPMDQIIKIPSYHDIPLEDEKPPPSIVINFQQNIGDVDDDEEDESIEEDEDQPLFDIDVTPTEQKTFGISNHLIKLFHELVKLINHKRMFKNLGKRGRNFPMICADYKDLLMKSTPNDDLHDLKDQTFYHCLIILFYKLIENYPSNLLSLHFQKLENYVLHNQGLNIFWFIKYTLDKKSMSEFESILNTRQVWLNNWQGKQIILELNKIGYGNDWYELLKQNNTEFFIF